MVNTPAKVRQRRLTVSKGASLRAQEVRDLAQLTRELLGKTTAELEAQGHADAKQRALELVSAAQGGATEELLTPRPKVHKPYILAGVDNDELEPAFVAQLKAIRFRNRSVRLQLGRLKNTVMRYAVDETLPRRRDVLYALLQLVERFNTLTVELYPYRLCPQCEGAGDVTCYCGARWWVSRKEYWAWQKEHTPLPEPTNPNLLGEP